jgi:hypothetical protein
LRLVRDTGGDGGDGGDLRIFGAQRTLLTVRRRASSRGVQQVGKREKDGHQIGADG